MLPVIRHINRSLEPVSLRSHWGDLERVFDEFWLGYLTNSRGFGSLDLYEDDQSIHIDVELPGVERKDIELTLEDGDLHIHAKRNLQKEEKETNYYVCERAEGQWSRSVRLPDQVQQNKIGASFRDGVLKVTLEKVEKSKPHKIEIN